MISTVLMTIMLLGLFALMATAALAPLETLSWWAGWTEEELGETPPAPSSEARPALRYIVYLSGVASISGRYLLPREKAFIRLLRKRLPGDVLVSNVFPYSPQGLPLLEAPRLFEQVWRRAQLFKLTDRQTFLSVLINLRNIFQVMVSADHRYGPIFNQGAASVIEAALDKAGYPRGSGAAVTIIGYSGGAQVAAGAAAFLTVRLRAPIDVISIGGVLASDPGLGYVRKFHHLIGDRDNVQRIGAAVFPERWPLIATSEWNAGKRDGRISAHVLPGVTHAGVNGYFGRPLIDGMSNAQRTAETIGGLL